MMLTADAFLGVPGELDRLRSGNMPLPANGEKAGKSTETAANGNSFPEMLESIQNAMDKAGESNPKGKAVLGEGAEKAENADGELLEATLEKGAFLGENLKLDTNKEKLRAEDEILREVLPVINADDVALQQMGENTPELITFNADVSNALVEVAEESSVIESAESAIEENPRLAAVLPEDLLQHEEALPSEVLADKGSAVIADAPPKVRELHREAIKENVSYVEDVKPNDSKSEEKAKVAIIDLRTDARPAAEKLRAGTATPESAVKASSDADVEMHLYFSADSTLENSSSFGKEGFGSSADASIFAQGGKAGGDGTSSATQGTGVAGSFAEKLAAEIKSNASDFVRAGQLVLKDGGEGTIRLALHPETLGAVRIHLEMSGDKKIAGKITVSSREAWDAFSESMDSLVLAFSDEGFDTLGFDLSWSGKQGEGIKEGAASAPFYASFVPDVMDEGTLSDDYSIAARREGSPYAVDIFA